MYSTQDVLYHFTVSSYCSVVFLWLFSFILSFCEGICMSHGFVISVDSDGFVVSYVDLGDDKDALAGLVVFIVLAGSCFVWVDID